MASMFFGQYLLAKGVIGREGLLDALNRQRRVNRNLAELALREGMLSAAQEQQVMLAFRTSDRSLDRILLGGYLEDRQLESLLAVQRAEHLKIGDALVAGGHLSQQQVERHLAEFLGEERMAQQRLEADLGGFRDGESITTCLKLTAFHMSRFTDRAVKLRSVEHGNGELVEGWTRFALHVVGDKVFCIALDLPDKLGGVLARGLLGLRGEPSPEVRRDAACELVNLIAGNACTHLESSGYRLRPEPPFVSGGEVPARPLGPSVHASFVSEEADFDVQLFFDLQPEQRG